MKRIKTDLIAFIAGATIALVAWSSIGCAILKPGEDPLVVRSEQAQQLAKANFDLVLNIDHTDREFWLVNAPRFHQFCEWLRQPQTVWVTNTLPRASAMILSVNNIKNAYKDAKATSNALMTALIVLESASMEAGAWALITTNNVTP